MSRYKDTLFVPATNATSLWRDYEEARKHQRHRKPVGRICAHDDCDTILSVHNPEKACWPHRKRRAPNHLGSDVREAK